MKSADDWVNDAMQRIESSWHTHYHSEWIGELEAAVAAFDEALALQPDHFDALYGKGLVLMKLDRYEDAAATFARALELRPDITELRRQLDQSLSRLAREKLAPAARELPKAPSEAAAPTPSRPEPKLRCPMCRSDRVVLEGAVPEIYELKCESCGHSEIFDIMSPDRESDSHWFE